MSQDDTAAVTVTRDIPFQRVDGETLTLDLYDSSATSGPKPVVVLVRGGGFAVGDKGEFARYAIDFASEGFLAIEPQYRLAPEWTFPAALVDVKAAIEWARTEGEQYGADADRIVGVGHSAGANLAVSAALTADEPGFEPEMYPGASSALSAVVGYAGIYDFNALDAAVDEAARSHREYLGGGPDDEPAAYELASPVAQVTVDAPPTLLLHSTDDQVVPSSQSALLADALSPMTEVSHDSVGSGHGFPFHGAEYDDVYDRTVAFLRRHGIAGDESTAVTERGGRADASGPRGRRGRPPTDDPGGLSDEARGPNRHDGSGF